MITHLFIQNYLLIRKLELAFYPGFSVITGETGAGKSILLEAINLLLGEKADTSAVLDPSKKCIIEATINVEKLIERNFFNELELDYEAVTIIRKEILTTGKSRVFINDTPVSLSTLRKFTEQIIDIHSQHTFFLLSQKKFQLAMLDQIANTSDEYQKYLVEWKKYGQLKRQTAQLKERLEKLEKEKDYYSYIVAEIDALNIKPDEIQQLEEELQILRNASKIKEDLYNLLFDLYNSDNALIQKGYNILRLFDNLQRHLNSIEPFRQRFNACLVELDDLRKEIEHFQEKITLDPQRLLELEQRYDIIQSILFKHKLKTLEELFTLRNNFIEYISEADKLSETLEQLEHETRLIHENLHNAAEFISAKRKSIIPFVEKQISNILKQLSIPYAKFCVHLSKKNTLSETAYDDLQFLFSANKSEEAKPLEKIASGGEMSRLMLALKAVMANSISLPVLFFDEIDSGVSGEVVKQMGSIFQQMGKKMQIIVITHLPQIAAMADYHIKVIKDQTANQTISKFRYLNEEEKVNEIATMLGGEKISKATLQTAQEMRQWTKIKRDAD